MIEDLPFEPNRSFHAAVGVTDDGAELVVKLGWTVVSMKEDWSTGLLGHGLVGPAMRLHRSTVTGFVSSCRSAGHADV